MPKRQFTIYYSFSILIFMTTIMLAGCGRKDIPVDISVNARSAVIMDAKTGKILFEKNADARFPPASTAKIMTAIVALDRLSLKHKIIPSKKAVYVEPTIAGLKAGVKYSLEDLLSAILIKSANDAAVVIAEESSGSEKNFAILMNQKAKEIGMENTYFATASGLPTGEKDSQYTTARDLSKMMRYAARHKLILEKISLKETNIYGSDGKRIYLKTHNKSLFKSDNAPWGKTGYTREARRTFTGVDPSMTPRIVFSLLKSTDLWNDIATLNDKGLEIYEEKSRTFFSDLTDWIKSQRQRGRHELALLQTFH